MTITMNEALLSKLVSERLWQAALNRVFSQDFKYLQENHVQCEGSNFREEAIRQKREEFKTKYDNNFQMMVKWRNSVYKTFWEQLQRVGGLALLIRACGCAEKFEENVSGILNHINEAYGLDQKAPNSLTIHTDAFHPFLYVEHNCLEVLKTKGLDTRIQRPEPTSSIYLTCGIREVRVQETITHEELVLRADAIEKGSFPLNLSQVCNYLRQCGWPQSHELKYLIFDQYYDGHKKVLVIEVKDTKWIINAMDPGGDFKGYRILIADKIVDTSGVVQMPS